MPVDDPSVLPPLPNLRRHDVLIVVPTCGKPGTVVPGAKRLLAHTDGLRVQVLFVGNPDDAARWSESRKMIEAAAQTSEADVSFLDLGAPVGFGAAVNRGIEDYRSRAGVPDYVVVVNDDAHVSAGWLSGMIAAFEPTDGVVLTGEPPDENGVRARRDPVLAVGRIGMVGPVSNLVAGVAQVRIPDGLRGAPYDVVAAQVRQQAAGEVEVVDFLSGFCVMYRRECLIDLTRGDGRLFDERFRIGGYEDNDVCVLADLAGWGRVVARSVYVHHDGHQTLDRIAPGAKRGMANQITYLRKWAGTRRTMPGKVVAVYRVRLETAQDIAYLRASIGRMSELVDGVVLLLNGSPLDITTSKDWPALGRQLPTDDHTLLRGCSGKDASNVAVEIEGWIKAVVAAAGPDARPMSLGVKAAIWQGPFNERDERNWTIAEAEALGADWIFSVDHDEVPEANVSRATLDRLMSHPDPMIRSWDVAFTTLWDTPGKQRIDRPWGDGGSYTGGMRGFRFFRASQSLLRPLRIAAGNAIGLHCGNVPDADPLAKRVSGIRMHHYGYLRPWDRARKHQRYTALDPNPDRVATGGGYGHLIHEESCILSPVVTTTGIGLHMLAHRGETAVDLGRQFDHWRGISDAIVLVWTDEANDDGSPANVPIDIAELASLYGVAIVHHPLSDDFSAARNAGLDALRNVQRTGHPPLGWAVTIDPDELLSDPFGDLVAVRRMAECSDAHAWLWRFANHRPSGTGEAPTASEALRMVRMAAPGFVPRYSGRVHEQFDAALHALSASGVRPVVRYAPFTVHNPGLSTDPLVLEQKVRFYQRLLIAELADNPRNASAWVSLGMQYTNDGFHDRALECFQRGVAADPNGYLGFRELALVKLREARVLFECVVGLLPPSHGYHRVAVEGVRFLQAFAPDQPLVGLAVRGPEHVPPNADVPLPAFPPAEPAAPLLLDLSPDPG